MICNMNTETDTITNPPPRRPKPSVCTTLADAGTTTNITTMLADAGTTMSTTTTLADAGTTMPITTTLADAGTITAAAKRARAVV